MRRLGYGLIVLAVLLATLPLASTAWRRWEAWRNLAPARNAGLDERVLFEPVGNRALEFNVSTHQGWFALQGFLVAPPALRARGVPLTIEVGVHGARGIVRERRYLALAPARVRPYGLMDGREDQATWVLPTEWIDLTGRPDVHAVSVRLLEAGDGVRTVLWRGAIDHRLSDAQARLRYRRLSDAAREALTADWITPAALVLPDIKQELLRYRQQRIGPLGQAGDDFVARRVLRQPPGALPRRYEARPLAIAIAPSMHVGVELDRERDVAIDGRGVGGLPLAFTLEGPIAVGARARRWQVEGRWRGTWVAGRYLLRSDMPGDVEVRDAESGDPLVPSGLRPRTQRATADRRLDYRLHALDGVPPPVRLRLRAERFDTSVTTDFLDAAGAVVASRVIDVPWRPSRFDRLAAAPDRPAAEAVQVDLQPPPQARHLRIVAQVPVLVHALTTLPPADRGSGRRWYSFQPGMDPRSVLSQGIVVIEQPRPELPRVARADPRRPTAPVRSGSGALPVRDVPARAADALPPRPRLRLRSERTETMEDADAD